ncbi:MAG: apolipoprotein N-acyltransferase [Kiritimatiellae bacterium]|nr:apolipoprotein N-acyltransferase [Kiritimatiellia bacterium]
MLRNIALRAAKFLWILPAYLLWAAFPPVGESFDVLFALAPLMWLTRRAPTGRAVKIWFANGLVFWLGTLSWMPAIIKNGGPWYLVALGWFALSVYCSGYFAMYAYLASKMWAWTKEENSYGRRLFALFVAEPLLFAGLELVRSRLFGGFAWNHLGVAPVMAGFGAPASLGGVYLLSALVVMVNGTIASMAERMWRGKDAFAIPSWARSVETVIPIAIVFAVYSAARTDGTGIDERPAGGDVASVALVQRNFPCCFSGTRGEDPIGTYGILSSMVAPFSPSLVVLGESALIEFGKVDSPNSAAFVRSLMEATGAKVVIAGGNRLDGERRDYNSAGVFTRGEEGCQIYDKVHLVPFGEFIPFDKVFTSLQRFAPVGSCTPGELKTVTLALGREAVAGLAICFEDTDSAQIRRLAEMGAEVLVFITNDSWFSHSHEAVQHSWQAVARAIETGLPVLRCGNSGVTGVIFPDGRHSFLARDGRPLVDEKGTMVETVSLGVKGDTWYVRLGDKPLFIAFALLIAAMILVNYTKLYEKRRYMSMQVRQDVR